MPPAVRNNQNHTEESVRLECKLKERFIMAGSIVRRHLNKNFELSGVFASAAAFLAFLNKQSAEEGMLYFDTTLDQLRTYDGTSWSPAGQNGVSAGSLDDAANIGTKITIDGALTSGIEIEATDAKISSDGALLLLDNNDTGSDVHSLEITSTSTAAAIKINNNTATTDDIQGTGDVWAITGQGLATFDTGVVILGDTASATLKLGAGSDITISYTDDGTPGTVGAGLMFKANTSADQIQIGDSTRAIDVWFEGSADANYMLWDASANRLILNGSDIRLEDNDILSFGDSDDVTITWNSSTPSLNIEALVDDTGQIRIGSTNAIDLAVYGSTNSNIALFDVSTAILEMNGWDIHLQDSDILQFGDASGGDVSIRWDGTDLDILAAADDTVIKFGTGTNSFDIWIYGNTSADNFIFDASANKLSLDGIDLKLEDDDYILLGDSATAGSATDGTIRWDASNSVIEIIGNTTFEGATIIVDNDLTVSGILTISGSLNPNSLLLGDTETLVFGDGSDYIISTAGSTAALIITAVNGDDAINIGDGSVATDFLIDNAGTAGADVWFDASADSTNGTWFFGANDKGIDVVFYGATAGDNITFDTSADRMQFEDIACTFMDDTTLLFGDGSSGAGDFSIQSDGSTLFIGEVSAAGKPVHFGVDNKGLDVKFFGETGSSFMLWDQSEDELTLSAAVLVTDLVSDGSGLQIPTKAGIPAGAAVDGSIVMDTSNDDLYVRSGGAWIKIALT